MSPSSSAAVRGHSPRILVCDDIAPLREFMRTILIRRLPDPDITLAADGHEVLERLRESRYDALVVDAHMPGLSGVETCIRARVADPDMGIALISAYRALPLSVSGFGGIGVDCVGFKPLGPVRFARIVKYLYQADRDLRARLRQRGAICIESEMGDVGTAVADPVTSRWCIQGHRNPRAARFCCDCGVRLIAEGDGERYTPEFGDPALTQEFAASLRDPEVAAIFSIGVARMNVTRALHRPGPAP